MGKKSTEGIVVKVSEDVIVLLCQDGTFKNVDSSYYDAPPLIGEHFVHIEKQISWLKYASIASVFLLTLISYILFPFGQADSSYVVAIDINPSIELTVDDAMNVIAASANNDDGQALLAEVEIKGQQLTNSIEEIISYSIDQGFFLDDKFLTTSVIPLSEKQNVLIEDIESIIETVINERDIEGVVLRNSKAIYEEAKKSNISVNQYAYYKELENEGVVKTIDEVKGKSIAELQKMKKVNNKPNENGNQQPKKSKEPKNVGPPNKEKEKGTPPTHSNGQQKQNNNIDQSQNEKSIKNKDTNQKQSKQAEKNYKTQSKRDENRQSKPPKQNESNRGASDNSKQQGANR